MKSGFCPNSSEVMQPILHRAMVQSRSSLKWTESPFPFSGAIVIGQVTNNGAWINIRAASVVMRETRLGGGID